MVTNYGGTGDLMCSSTDVKPTDVAVNTRCLELDTGKFWFFNGTTWTETPGGGGGGSATLIEKNISANGTYAASADEADGYSSVEVDVPNTYTVDDNGKVVSNQTLVPQTATTATVNGTIDTTLNNEVVIAVPNTYTVEDNGKVVDNQQLVAQSAYPSTIVANGTYDTTLNNSVTVDMADVGSIIDGSITSLVVPDGVTTIADYKMYAGNANMRNLTQLSLPSTITHIGMYAFYGQINIVGEITLSNCNIGEHAFGGVSGLSIIPTGFNLTLINPIWSYSAFAKSVLKNVVIIGLPTTTASTSLGATSPFYGSYLETFTANDIINGANGSDTIWFYGGAFNGSKRLHTVTMNKLTSVHDSMFYGCTALENVTLPMVTSGASSAFRGCTALQSISFPAWTGSIPSNMFYGCTSLENVSFGRFSIINASAFYNCTSLTTINISSQCGSIGANAFYNCTSLTSIKFLGSTPPIVGSSSTWTGIPTTCTIYVPTGSLSAYTSASNYPNPSTYTYVEY